MNDKLMEIDASFSESRIDIAIPGLSYTLLVDNQPILAGGIYPLWDGVAEGWVLSSKRILITKLNQQSQSRED